jgi:SAM-dependent methyltransferase
VLSDERMGEDDRIAEGTLSCAACAATYPIQSYIPRFVPVENYASGFGLQWTIHDRTQYDAESGLPLSETRFFDETQWPRRLEGEVVIEAGSGSGRFTEHAAGTGATVLSFDYSYAVEGNYRSNGHRPNVLIVQADVFRMPFRPGSADRVFCFGVLQHTPDPRRAFIALAKCVRAGGNVTADVYLKSFSKYVLGTKYWVRPCTRRLPPQLLYRATQRYITFIWPLARLVRRIPRLGPALNWRLLVGDYGRLFADDSMLRRWAALDTFDMLAPRYDLPQTLAGVREWCSEADLVDVEVDRGYNGIVIRGKTRATPVTGPSALGYQAR